MTGELCDCFDSKADGVRHILRAVEEVSGPAAIRIWTTAGDFRSCADIVREPLLAAASNWVALATYVGRLAPHGAAILIDLGSTTCDIIPLVDGQPRASGRTDSARLASGELVYCGIRRTPLCALFGLAKAAEWFATTGDVYVVLADIAEEPQRTDTADGRPHTKAFAQARLARMECADGADWSWGRTLEFARQARDMQVRRLAEGVAQVAARLPMPISTLILAGAGEFLLPSVLDAAGLGSATRISLAETLGANLSIAACAYAVATLAAEQP